MSWSPFPGADRRRARGPIATIVALALTLPVFLASAAASSDGSDVVTAPVFLERVERARSLAEAGGSSPGPAAMDSIRGSLGLPVTLTLSGGSVRIELDPFLSSLRGDDADDFRLAAEHLLALAEDVRTAETVPAADREAVGRALERAYSGIREASPLERLGAYARTLLARILSTLVDSLSTFRGFGSVVAWAVVLGVAVLVVLVLRKLGIGLVPERARAAGGDESTAPDWKRLAEEALRRNDLREATRALHHALVSTLAARGILGAAPSTTAGECREAVARVVPDLYASVSKATRAFERVAYGGAAPALEDVDAIAAANREAGR